MVQPLPKSDPFAMIRAFTQPRRNQLAGLASGLLSGNDWGPGLGMGFARAAEGRQVDDAIAATQKAEAERARQLQETIGYLRTQPGGATWADAVERGDADPKDAFKGWYEESGELEKAKRNAYLIKDPDLKAMVENGAIPFKDALEYERGTAGGSQLGTTVYLGRDEQGNSVPMQVGQQGFVPSQLPPGISFDPGGMAGARTNATVDAKTQGAARAALPGAEQNIKIALDSIERLRNNKQGQDEQFGSLFGVIPNRNIGAWKGTEMANFQGDLAQAGGQAFMQARNALKGGGQITDFEGKRAEDAITRMAKAAETGDQEAFNDALDEFESAIIDGYSKLQQVANGTYEPSFMPAQPGGSMGGGPAPSGDYVTRYGLEQ